MRSRTGLLVSAMVVLALGLGVGARSLAQTGGGAATPKTWNEVLAAAKKEGVVVWSPYAAPGASADKQIAEFERLHGIRVEVVPGRTGDFEARWNAERAAGKPSIDLRSSGSPENRRLAARGLDQSFGTLPCSRSPVWSGSSIRWST